MRADTIKGHTSENQGCLFVGERAREETVLGCTMQNWVYVVYIYIYIYIYICVYNIYIFIYSTLDIFTMISFIGI